MVVVELRNESGYELEDPLEEDQDAPVPGLTHRYPDRALLVTTHVCTMYCRFCTRKRATMVRGGWDAISRNDERMIEYVREHPEIRDVIVSGGDPLTLPANKLKFFLDSLAEIPHDEQRHMVAPGIAIVEVHAVQARRRAKLDIALLAQLARDRLRDCLAGLDPAAGEMPAAHVAVLDQKDAPVGVDHQRPHAERHRPRKAPIEVEEAPDGRLAGLARSVEIHPFHRVGRAP